MMDFAFWYLVCNTRSLYLFTNIGNTSTATTPITPKVINVSAKVNALLLAEGADEPFLIEGVSLPPPDHVSDSFHIYPPFIQYMPYYTYFTYFWQYINNHVVGIVIPTYRGEAVGRIY